MSVDIDLNNLASLIQLSPKDRSGRIKYLAPQSGAVSAFATATGSALLLFKNEHNKAIRIEAPSIGLEFSDGLYIGRDPPGVLYFNALSDFDPQYKHNYKVTRVQNPTNKLYYAQVDLTHEGSTTPYAQFVALDDNNNVDANGFDGGTGTGEWKTLQLGSSFATVKKVSTSNKVDIVLDSVFINANWESTNNDQIGFNVRGIVYFRDTKKLVNAKYVNHSRDRIVFYEDDYTGTDFDGYFIPLQGIQVPPVNDYIAEDIKWTQK